MANDEMFINFYDPRGSTPFYGMIASAIFTNRDSSYQGLYDAICKHPSYVILSDLETDKKIKIINNMVDYYEAIEAYEKCATLLDIKKRIEEYAENPSR